MIWQSLRFGSSQVLGNKRILFFYYLINLVLGIALIVPLSKLFSNFAGHSLFGNRLTNNFDINFFVEFFREHGDAFGVWSIYLVIGALFYWGLMLFLSGGVLHVYIHEIRGTLTSVLGNSSKYFGRMIRLSLWSLPVLALLLATQYIYSGLQRLIFGKDPYQSVLYWSVWIKMGIRFLVLWFFAIIFDYARIHLVQTNERRTRKSLIAALKFVGKNLGKTVGLKAVLVLAGIIALMILLLIQNPLNKSVGAGVIIAFLIGQIYLLFRIYLKLVTFSSQAELKRSVESDDRIKQGDEILLAV